MAWCHQATSHYLSQCWPRSLSPNDVTRPQWVNSLAPGKFEWNFRHLILKQILVIDGWGNCCEIALIWMSLDFTDDQSTLVQIMAWCRQATSHYLSQCWPGACPTKYRIDQIRSNSNFAWNSYRCAFEDSRPIITKFGTRYDSRTVVTCTKFRYDRPIIIEIRGTRIFSKFWIRSNLSIRYLVGQAPGLCRHLPSLGHNELIRLEENGWYFAEKIFKPISLK